MEEEKKVGHGWMAETAFSTIKRSFGEYISVTRFDNMVKEMMTRYYFAIMRSHL